MKALYITDWKQYFEVNADGRRWQLGQKLRAGPLRFITWYVLGPDGGNVAYSDTAAEVADRFGEEAWIVAWGLFAKLIEVAGRQDAEHRGYILGKEGSPISARRLRLLVCFPQEQIDLGVKVLTDPAIRWLEWRELPGTEGVSPNSANGAGLGESRRPFKNETRTKLNSTQLNENETQSSAAEDGGEGGDAEDGASDSSLNGGGDSRFVSSEGQDSAKAVSPAKFAVAMFHALGVGMGNRKQFAADNTTFERMADHINAGDLGAVDANLLDVVQRAAVGFRTDPTCRNKAGSMVDWFKRMLAERGLEWKNADKEKGGT